MKKVTLRNAKRMPFLATVYHDIACKISKVCTCKVTFVTGPKGKRVSQKQPLSFQIDALSSKEVPESVLHLPQVKKALKEGWLVKVDKPEYKHEAIIPSWTAKDKEGGE